VKPTRPFLLRLAARTGANRRRPKSVSRAALRLVVVSLFTLALLPPLSWGLIGLALERRAVTAEHSLGDLAFTTSIVAVLSVALALALWGWAFMRPVTRLQRAERRVRTYEFTDRLTGLHDRQEFRRRLMHALARARGSGMQLGILVIDVDRFGLVNGSLGQEAGDLLLHSVAQRLRSVTRKNDVLGRLAADQFAVVATGISGTPALTAMARNLVRAFDSPHRLASHETVVTLSIGVALADPANDTIDDLSVRADSAMRAAKAAGGGQFRVFEEAMTVDARKRLDIEARLRRALAEDEFFLMYQPIVDGTGDVVVGVETLLRWRDPERGVVAPGDFIPVLEQTGMIVPLGRRVLNEACLRVARWNARQAPHLRVSVNVSPRQFLEACFVDTVLDALTQSRLAPGHLTLEVTEGLLLDPGQDTQVKLDQLADIGVHLAIDDFGTGYASIASLKRFRVHELKMDKSLVNDVATSGRDVSIARAIVDLGHSLGLDVTAEGVETREQFETLRGVGCNRFQGWLFCAAIDADRLTAALTHPRPVQALDARTPDAPAEAARGGSSGGLPRPGGVLNTA